jgi:U3 small nucleolar RNA-associated protein 21
VTTSGSFSTPDEAFFTSAKSLSPAAADLEIRTLATVEELSLFLRALSQRLKSHRDFEAIQTYLNVFLRVHGEVLVSNPGLRSDLEAFLSLQRQESSRLLDSIASCLGTLAFVRDTL